MSDLDYRIRFLGWCFDVKHNHDKVWGWVEIEGKVYNFWGKRDFSGKNTLRFKRHPDAWHSCRTLTNSKIHKGYKDYTSNRNSVISDFDNVFKRELTDARMMGKVMCEDL